LKFKTKLLEKQMRTAKQSVIILTKCFKEYYVGNSEKVKECKRKINALEDETDHIKEKVDLHFGELETGFRKKNSALALSAKISLIADYSEDVAILLNMRPDSIPKRTWKDFKKFMDCIQISVNKLEDCIMVAHTQKGRKCKDCEYFVRMYEGANLGSCKKVDENQYIPGFRNENNRCELDEKDSILRLSQEVSEAEEDADIIERRLRKQLYCDELGLDPMRALHFLKIVENFDMIANVAEEGANYLKSMY